MTSQLILLPILFQAFTAIVLLFFWRKPSYQRLISVLGSSIHLSMAILLFDGVLRGGVVSVQAGNWEAPFGITFVADTLAATMVLLTSLSALAVSIYSAGTIVRGRVKYGYFPIFHFLIMGLCGAFLTGDIFNLYVWFEIIIISSFVLLTLGSEKKQLEGAVKYFSLNMLASIIFLTALGILYGLVGTLNMADLSAKIAAEQNRGLVYVSGLFFFVGFGIKSALFPLYFWLPDSYHTPPSAVSAIFSGLLTKVGVYALIRVFTLIFIGDVFIDQVLLGIGMLTLFSGAVGALVQHNLRRAFSYLIISHIGFIIVGLGLLNEQSVTGAMYYLIHDVVVKTNLFLIAGLLFKIKGTDDMRQPGGIYDRYPKLSLLMAITLFSVVGIPPLSGFWPKISLILGAFSAESYGAVGFILLGSLLTLVIIARIWSRVFWNAGTPEPPRPEFIYFKDLGRPAKIAIIFPIALLTIISLYIGFAAEHIQLLSGRIANELLNPSIYIDAVLKK